MHSYIMSVGVLVHKRIDGSFWLMTSDSVKELLNCQRFSKIAITFNEWIIGTELCIRATISSN